MELNDFSSSIIYLTNICEELCSLTGNDDRNVHPYWVRTLKSFSKAITTKIATEYLIRNTPESGRFLGLKEKFKDIYDIFVDEFSQPLMISVGDKKKVNDEWLRIEGDISDGEFCTEELRQDSSLSKNRALVVNIYTPTEEQVKKGSVKIELALSEIYRAAIYVDRNVIKKPRYPYAVIYGIYNCIKYSAPEDSLAEKFYDVINGLYRNRADLLEKDQTSIDQAISSVKSQFSDIANENKDALGGMMSEIRSGLDELTDDTIDQIAEEAHGAIKAFEKNKNGDLSSVIGSLMGADSKQVEETMRNVGLHENNIKRIIDVASGTGTSKSNAELLSSIPNDIDFFINGK